jgi:hypothetical protein
LAKYSSQSATVPSENAGRVATLNTDRAVLGHQDAQRHPLHGIGKIRRLRRQRPDLKVVRHQHLNANFGTPGE